MSAWLRRLLSPAPVAVPLSEIRSSFEEAASDEEHFPSTIDPRIWHVQLLLRYFAEMNQGEMNQGSVAGLRVADIGCGKGRFARVLREQGASLVALDLAEAMLRRVPGGVDPVCGSMTALPFGSRAFDAAYAIESLEHAVDIESGIAELCRIVKPNGRIVIIDKNADHWGKLQTSAWEKWFRREELEKLLRRHCRHVESEFISYWEDVPPDGMFIAWKAIL